MNMCFPCFTFSAYHALKANYRSGKFSNAPDGMTQTQLRKNWSLFAEVLMTEAGEAHVHRRAFSLVRFICYLCKASLPVFLPIRSVNACMCTETYHNTDAFVSMTSKTHMYIYRYILYRINFIVYGFRLLNII